MRGVEAERPSGPPSGVSVATLAQVDGGRGVLPARIRPAWIGARVHGPAWPVRIARGDNRGLHEAIYAAPPGAVIVAAPGGGPFAYWGELMTRAALERSVAGVVLDGGARDLARIQALGFPVFATGPQLRSTSKRIASSGPTSIRVGATLVAEADLVVGDGDGVAIVPRARVEAVLERARAHDRREAAIIRQLESGRPLLELLGGGGSAGD